MLTRSGSEYHLGETSDILSSKRMSSNAEKSNTSLDPSLLAILEDIRGKVVNLGQRIDMIENERRDQDRNEDTNAERIESIGTMTDMRIMRVI